MIRVEREAWRKRKRKIFTIVVVIAALALIYYTLGEATHSATKKKRHSRPVHQKINKARLKAYLQKQVLGVEHELTSEKELLIEELQQDAEALQKEHRAEEREVERLVDDWAAVNDKQAMNEDVVDSLLLKLAEVSLSGSEYNKLLQEFSEAEENAVRIDILEKDLAALVDDALTELREISEQVKDVLQEELFVIEQEKSEALNAKQENEMMQMLLEQQRESLSEREENVEHVIEALDAELDSVRNVDEQEQLVDQKELAVNDLQDINTNKQVVAEVLVNELEKQLRIDGRLEQLSEKEEAVLEQLEE